MKRWLALSVLLCVLDGTGCARRDPLPSWNEGATKRSITSFVAKVTTHGSPSFVKPAERIAVFDNDGTLWCEQPTYPQRVFIVDRIRQLAPRHPEWKDAEPYKSVLAAARDDDDSAASAAVTLPAKDMLALAAAASDGADVDEFDGAARTWVKSARNPKYHRSYTGLAYQPMLELLAYLRANGFKTFIVTGGGADFVRVLSEDCYGVAPEQVLGSANELTLETREGKPVLVKGGKVTSALDGAGKAIAIRNQIGRRPVMAFGNSDGDLQMLQYTAAGDGARFAALVHHTDDVREVAYDRASKVGRLDKGLDEAAAESWTVVDIKQDWKTIFRTGDR